MFDIPTDFFHGHSNYLEIEIFNFGNFSKFREKTPGKWFPGKKFSRELPGNHFLGQNYHMNPIGHLFSNHDVTCGSDFSYSLTDALLRDNPVQILGTIKRLEHAHKSQAVFEVTTASKQLQV